MPTPKHTALLQLLRDQFGKPYVIGSTGPESFDCSSLCAFAFKEVYGIDLPRRSTDQFTVGMRVERPDLMVGDLVFFDTGWTDRKPNHVGVYCGDGMFINASSYHNAVREDDLESSYWKGVYYGARRVVHADDTPVVNPEPVTPVRDARIMLSEGDLSPAVKALQQRLAGLGFFSGQTFTETYGSQTKRAVLFYQLAHQLIDSPTHADAGIYTQEMATHLSSLSADFPDVPLGYQFYPYITYLVTKKVMAGYGDHTFRPTRSINRAELLKVLSVAFSLPPHTGASPFSDVRAGEWFTPFVLSAHHLGIVRGYPDGTFRPEQAVTRAEALKMIFSAAKLPVSTYTPSTSYIDLDANHWYYQVYTTALYKGLIKPRTSTSLGANEPIARGEVAGVVGRLLLTI